MKLRFCVICGTNKNLEHHHIKPLSMGGDDHQHNFLTLCTEHHSMIHQIRPGYWNKMRKLQKEGFRKAKERGVKFGRKRTYTPKQEEQVWEHREKGYGYGTIGKMLGLHPSMIKRIIKGV
jgi:predicted restriction endonuclease